MQLNFHVMIRNICFSALFFLLPLKAGLSQTVHENGLFFMADCQQPLIVEKLFLKPYRNTEARDSLFSDISRLSPRHMFFLGDMVGLGSFQRDWKPFDRFLSRLRQSKTDVFAIPGNHEYKLNPLSGIKQFQKRFPGQSIYGFCVKTDSTAIVMLNSNFNHIPLQMAEKQYNWYNQTLDSLEKDEGILAVIVCAHHSPYSNSKIVGSSKTVEQSFVPAFEKCKKARLFITGHSHNLEYFETKPGKNFLVIGGGGGLTQPLLPEMQRRHKDLAKQPDKPLYFYIVVSRKGNQILAKARGFKRDFRFYELNI